MTRASQTRASGRARLAQVGLPPRGLSEDEAAAYIGVSPGTFRTLCTDGRMPAARAINGRLVWDRLDIDEHFTRLPSAGGSVDTDIGHDPAWEARA